MAHDQDANDTADFPKDDAVGEDSQRKHSTLSAGWSSDFRMFLKQVNHALELFEKPHGEGNAPFTAIEPSCGRQVFGG